LRGSLSLIVGLIILGIIISTQVSSFDTLISTQTHANWKWAIASFSFFFAHGLVVYFSWAKSLDYYNIYVNKKSSAVIHFISLISRYLPGGIWHIAGRFIAVVKKGGNSQKVLSTLYLEQMIALITSIFIIVCVFWYQPNTYDGIVDFSLKNWAMLISAGLLLFIIFPQLLVQAMNILFKLFGKGPITSLSRLQIYKIFGFHLVSMFLYAFAYYYSAHIYIDNPDIVMLIGVVMLATFLGFIAIFVPSGLGVREGVLIAYLNIQGIEGAIAISIVLLPRLLILSAEVLSVFIALTIMKVTTKNG